MNEVYLWVPSKGWKKILSTKSLRKAIATALEFVPLEVRLQDKDGRSWSSGCAHIQLRGCNTLEQIERLNDSLITEENENVA
jgi:hypothetical protein